MRRSEGRLDGAAYETCHDDRTKTGRALQNWRVIRGGSWFTAAPYARASARAYAEAGEASCYTGFRVLREVTGK